MRFWLMRTKVERNMASADANVPRTTKDSSHFGRNETNPVFTAIQMPNNTAWMYTNAMLPAKRVMNWAARS